MCALIALSIGAESEAAAAAAPGELAHAAQSERAQRAIEISLPLVANGFYLGDISVRAGGDGQVIDLDGVRLLELLTPRLRAEAAATLEARVQAGGGRLDLAGAALPGLALSYDDAELRLTVSIDGATSRANEINLAPVVIDRPTEASTLPSPLAAGLNLFASKAYLHEARARPTQEGFQATTIGADGFVNLGGLDGLYLLHQWTYVGGRTDRLTRGPVTLLRDDWKNAVRFAAGDVDPVPLSFQGAAPLGGVWIASAYAELQPTRNIRPSGRTTFTLDRDSIVEVEVNGIVTRTLQLGAGTFDLRDLPFTEGLNEVRLIVQDSAGRREIASFSRSFTSTLLDVGLTEFSFALGVPRRATPGGFAYGSQPQATGFFRSGLTANITTGINLQADRRVQLLGTEAIWANPIGTFRLELAGSRTRDVGYGYATTLGYTRSFAIGSLLGEVQAFWEHRSARFGALNTGLFAQDVRNDLAVRWRQELPGELFLNATFGRTERRFTDSRTQWGVGLNRSFGRLAVGVQYDGEKSSQTGTRHAAFITLSVRLDDRQSVSARYQTRENRFRLEYDRTVLNALGDFGVRGGVGFAQGERSFVGQVSYLANRAEVGAQFDLFDDTFGGDRVRQTTLRAAMGLGFAGGQLAVGRPFADGFAIVKGHRTLEGRRVDVSAGATDLVYARTGFWGPALVTTNRGYQRNIFRVNVRDLPAGYDIGSGGYELFPGTRSGFSVTVGSEASRTILGTLVGADGAPVSLLVGELRDLGRPEAAPIPIFTNRVGRFSATGLRTGRYALRIADKNTGLIIEVKEDQSGLINLGRLALAEGG